MERENNYTPGNEAYDEETDAGKSSEQGSTGGPRIVCPLHVHYLKLLSTGHFRARKCVKSCKRDYFS